MDSLHAGPLEVVFHRTVRVAEDRLSNLPPSLGALPIYEQEGNFFLALHDQEATWINFQPEFPVAVIVGAGGVNALTGKPLEVSLEDGNYLVTPPQPWLDGWKGEDGAVYQFVALPFQEGKGLTVGEQLLGKASSSELEIIVFEGKNPQELIMRTPKEVAGWSADEPCDLEKLDILGQNAQLMGCCDYKAAKTMGLGKGGKITQKIYPDPYGLDSWKTDPTGKVRVSIVNAKEYAEMTGRELPPLPQSFLEYTGLWFGLKDEQLGDVKGTDAFTNLKAFSEQKVAH